MKIKRINIDDAALDRYHLKAKKIIQSFITESSGYAQNFIQYYYNNVILPQIIVDDILTKYRGEVIHVTVPGLSLRIYIRDNSAYTDADSAKGYTYSTEPML